MSAPQKKPNNSGWYSWPIIIVPLRPGDLACRPDPAVCQHLRRGEAADHALLPAQALRRGADGGGGGGRGGPGSGQGQRGREPGNRQPPKERRPGEPGPCHGRRPVRHGPGCGRRGAGGGGPGQGVRRRRAESGGAQEGREEKEEEKEGAGEAPRQASAGHRPVSAGPGRCSWRGRRGGDPAGLDLLPGGPVHGPGLRRRRRHHVGPGPVPGPHGPADQPLHQRHRRGGGHAPG